MIPFVELPRPSSADYNLRILWPLARWVEDKLGGPTLAKIVEGTGVSPAQFDAKSDWVSAETFEAILARARALMPDDETFMRASTYRIKEAYGPIRYVLWATSPGAVCAQMVKTYQLVSTVGKLNMVSHDASHFHVRVEPNGRAISRLTCLVRQANCRVLPTMWGMPMAQVKESGCIGLGDATCELHLRWYAARSFLPILLGTAIFGILGLVLRRFGIASVPTPLFLATLGASLGYVFEVRRTERINQSTRQDMMDALRQLAAEEAETRREIFALHQRQKEWTRLIEEQVGERTSTLERVVGGMKELQQERASTLLGFSHDLRSPLQVVQFGAEVVRMRCPDDPYVTGVVDDMDQALGQMKRMLSDLVKTASGHRATLQFTSQRIDVSELTERLRRRLRALVHGRDVRATVFETREAPDAIEIDPLLMDRIADNLLTNAAKYTERGSIIVELDGTPGFLAIKVSDTGCGIDPSAMARIFEPGGSSVDSRRGDSFGVGLSVVIQLLERIGGRLEVMSKP
ncbi:MAG: HAMP domain-containing histidine kinase, partial [Myxococcota bacterium]|nr:HAMP domain-containing histidine kinase [Myxococcota bacterium]